MASPTPYDIQTTCQNRYDYQSYANSGELAASGVNVAPWLDTMLIRDRLVLSTVNTPGFKALKRARAPLPRNPYHKYVDHWFIPKVSFSQTNRNLETGHFTNYQIRANLGAYTSNPQINSAYYSDSIISTCYNRLIKSISENKANSAVSLAEMDKTAGLVAHTARRVASGLNALKHGRLLDFAKALGLKKFNTRDVETFDRRYRKFKFSRKEVNRRFSRVRGESRITDFVADSWLEYSYGWKPLLNDVYQHAEAAATIFTERSGDWRTASASAQSKRTTTLKDSSSIYLNTSEVITSSQSIQMDVVFRIPNGAVSITTALGLNNPLLVAWELVPFSFVVDWFLPVGNSIASLTAFSGLEFASGSYFGKHFYTADKKLTFKSSVSGGQSVVFNGGPLTGRVDVVDLVRVVLTDFPSFVPPEFRDPRSFAHAASAIALLQSLFLRK